jgi:CBS domain-containing protein
VRRIQRSIAECISKADFVSVGPDDPVSVAVDGMRAKGTHCALVVADGKLAGIFTERDFLRRVALERRDPAATRMHDVMTAQPEALRAHDCISYAINRMATKRFRNVPIVDRNSRPTSVLDAQLVMLHLLKVFAEVEQAGPDDESWIETGGGG